MHSKTFLAVSLTASLVFMSLYAESSQAVDVTLIDESSLKEYIAEGHVGPYAPFVDTKQPQGQIPAGYNKTAAIDVDGGCDIFTTAAFTFWDVQQDGMKIGSTYSSPVHSGFTDTLFLKDEYKAGFKVGIGANTRCDDNWVVSANYAWFDHALHKNQGSFPFLSTPFVLIGGGGGGVVFTNSNHRWHFGVSILDVELARPFYQGLRLTINPFFGIRTQWLSQRYRLSGMTTLGSASEATWKSSSWGLGPKLGFDMNWLLGAGFKLIASASGSLIYTHYSPLRYNEPTASPTAYSISFSSQNYLRGDADGKLGFGWGSYVGNNKFHLEFAATYDFQIFWNQNMITWMMNNISNVDASAGNLYLNGLTISGRFDF